MIFAALLVLGLSGAALYWLFSHQPEATALIQAASATPTRPGNVTKTTTVQTATPETVSQQLTQESDASPTIPAVTLTPRPSPTPSLTATPTATTLLTEIPVAQPTSATRLDLIAFNSNRSGNNDIYVMNADGSQVKQLTTGPFDERIPSWSPDGEKIAYQSNEGGDYEIFVYSLSTGQVRQVTDDDCGDFNPVWSPDGEWFAYYSDCDGNREIYKIRADGSGRQQLTRTNDVYNWFPNWSPNGRKITFSSNRSGEYQVYTMNTDGTGVTPLVTGCLGAFSPDGEWIVFAQFCTDLGQLYMANSDGTGLHVLDAQERNANPAWSPDGGLIVFQSDRSGNEEIWVMRLDGSYLEQLTFDRGRDSAPVWQPEEIEPQSAAPSSGNADLGAGAT